MKGADMNNLNEDRLGALLAEALAVRRGFSSADARKIRTAAILAQADEFITKADHTPAIQQKDSFT